MYMIDSLYTLTETYCTVCIHLQLVLLQLQADQKYASHNLHICTFVYFFTDTCIHMLKNMSLGDEVSSTANMYSCTRYKHNACSKPPSILIANCFNFVLVPPDIVLTEPYRLSQLMKQSQ